MAKTARGPLDYFSPGDWNAICSMCGTKGKASEMVQNWQGMWRHPKCNEPRQPQDFAQALNQPEMAVPWTQQDGDIDILAPAFPLSGVAVTNTYTFPIIAFWYMQGANLTEILVNGVSISLQLVSYTIPAGETIAFAYTNGNPTWAWTGAFQ